MRGRKAQRSRHFDRRRKRLGQIGEQRRHFRAGLEAVLRRELAALAVGDQPALGDAEKRIVRLVVVTRGEIRLVGRDERQPARISKLDQRRLGDPLRRHAVTLQLDVKAVTEQALQFLAARLHERALAGADRAIERTVRSAAERNQSARLAVEPRQLDVRLLRLLGVEICARAKPHQAAVALLACRKEHDAGKALPGRRPAMLLIAEVDPERAADDRLNAGARHLLGEFQRTEHVVGVGQRQRRLAVFLGKLRQARNRQRALEQRIRRMNVQMHEAGRCGGHNPRFSRLPILPAAKMRDGARRCPSS